MCVRISRHEPCPRLFVILVIGNRTLLSLSNLLTLQAYLKSSEQLRRLQFQPASEPEPAPPTISDDNTSIYQKNDRRVYTCAVCRTKESESWWKAPRNLPTNSMCDDCGILWRKYAIKSARGTDKEKEYLARIQQNSNIGTPDPPSTRSGAVANKGQAVDKTKREGTPLVTPAVKKAKVGHFFICTSLPYGWDIGRQRYCDTAEASVLSVPKSRAARTGRQMCEVRFHCSLR
jgi:hypothetical protein